MMASSDMTWTCNKMVTQRPVGNQTRLRPHLMMLHYYAVYLSRMHVAKVSFDVYFKGKPSPFIAQYPVLLTAYGTLHFTPSRPVQSNTVSPF